MNTQIFKLLLLLIIAGLTSCTVERGYGSWFVIINDSSHDIEIRSIKVDSALKIPDTVTIESGSLASFPCGCYEEGFHRPMLDRVAVIFDSNITIEYLSSTEYHSICNYHEPVFEQTGEYEGTFTFTFTDADYEYAVSQQTE